MLNKRGKKCTRCLKIKDISEFHKQSRSKTGIRSYCRSCCSALERKYNKQKVKENPTHYRDRMREYRKNNKDKDKDLILKRIHGISLEEYNELFYVQEGKCAICGKHQNELTKALSVDHNHITGKIRGLLCMWCNSGLGNFKDNLDLLDKAKEYLNSEFCYESS